MWEAPPSSLGVYPQRTHKKIKKLLLNNSCCKDFVVSEEMVNELNSSSMYAHDTNEGDADTKEFDDVELISEILQE